MRRQRLIYLGGVLGVMLLGLLWRRPVWGLSPFLSKYGGDALWALLVYLLIRAANPRGKIWMAVDLALGFSMAIELSQLYHAPWIDAVRATRLGGLVLGSFFSPYDLYAYAVGIAIGGLLDGFCGRKSGAS